MSLAIEAHRPCRLAPTCVLAARTVAGSARGVTEFYISLSLRDSVANHYAVMSRWKKPSITAPKPRSPA